MMKVFEITNILIIKYLFCRIIPFFLFSGCFFSCVPEDKYDTSPQTNFDALWKILDERYCFFETKGVDWQAVYRKYQQHIRTNMSDEALFDVLATMLAELKDGHVNLSTPFNIARYHEWYSGFPDNFDAKIQRAYLGNDYNMASGMRYRILDDNVGYLYCGDFSNVIGAGNVDWMIYTFSICRGMIIDVRNNGGGLLSNVETLASRYTNKRILTGYTRYKTGKGHDDFSAPQARYLEPASRIRFQKPVVVLTNRHCFSATNEFVNVMHL
ncbi:MAG: S41 family peptidase, partial [Bacteroidales bacterium]|nr:S41 family peptidase [Bacteroidales bacterium]